MPLFKKSQSDPGVLSDRNRKALRLCRMTLIKDLNISAILEPLLAEDVLRADMKEQLLNLASREERASFFVDKLEKRNDHAFSSFMKVLREHQKQLHYVLEKTLDNANGMEEVRSLDRAVLTGDTVRKLIRTSKNGSHDVSVDEIELISDEKEDENYLECYTIPLCSQLNRKSWVSNGRTSSLCDNERPNANENDNTYMAVLTKDIVCKKLCKSDLPQNVLKPPATCSVFIFDANGDEYIRAKNKTQDSDDIPNNQPSPMSELALPLLRASPLSNKYSSADGVAIIPPRLTKSSEKKGRPPKTLPKPRVRIEPGGVGGQVFQWVRMEDEEPRSPNEPPVPPVPPRTTSREQDGDDEQRRTPSPPPPPRRALEKVPEISSSSEALHAQGGPRETKTSVNDQGSPEQDSDAKADKADINQEDDKQEEPPDYAAVSPTAPELPPRNKLRPDFPTGSCTASATEEDPEVVSGGQDQKGTEGLNVDADNDRTRERDNEKPEQEESHMSEAETASVSEARENDDVTDDETIISKEESSRETTPGGEEIQGTKPPPSAEALANHDNIANNGQDSRGKNPPVMKPAVTRSSSCSRPEDWSTSMELAVHPLSDEESYYESIEVAGNSASLGRTSSSYLDPKRYVTPPYGKIPIELVTDLMEDKYQSFYDIQAIVDAGKILLSKGDLLVATRELVIPDGTVSATEQLPESLSQFKDCVLAYDKLGQAFYLCKDCVKVHGDPEGEPWFYPINLSSRQATMFLSATKQEGSFVIYRPVGGTSGATYNLSLCSKEGDIVHYHICKNSHGDLMISGDERSFINLQDMVDYYQRNKGRLVTRLRRPLKEVNFPIRPGYHFDKRWEISRPSLAITSKILGKGFFGIVCEGIYKGCDVAVKVLQKADACAVEEDDFLQEARMLMMLRHEQVVRLVGVSVTARPYFLVTEYLCKGNLLECLRSREIQVANIDLLFDICLQMAAAGSYLESRRYMIHRDIAARNCLVAEDRCVKLADFGRACYVVDDYYQAPKWEKLAVKWAAPEVLTESRYSTKSDVWSLGVLFWEVFSGGEKPYSHMSAEQAAVYVMEGGRLEKPLGCALDIYTMMRSCWRNNSFERPSFETLYDKLKGKSSIYYGTVPPRQSLPGSPVLLPERVGPPMTPPPNARRAVVSDSKSEEAVKDFMSRYSRDESHINISREHLESSSSEASLAKDDLSRSNKIRKSLSKIVKIKGKKKERQSRGKDDKPPTLCEYANEPRKYTPTNV